MLSQLSVPCVYLARGATDMRKSIDALVAIVSLDFELDVFSQALFVFCNRSRDKIKIIHWDTNGFWLYYRRLEKGRFAWPRSTDGGVVQISRRQLEWLLAGLTIEQSQAHREVLARRVA
jgi:transposase